MTYEGLASFAASDGRLPYQSPICQAFVGLGLFKFPQ